MDIVRQQLRKYFGYHDFRNGQERIVRELVSGTDVLSIMPTGAGKSLCYQLPAMVLDGIALVICPLISLMRDQVSALTHMGIPAAFINSTLSGGQISTVLERAGCGHYKIVYVAPERLDSGAFRRFAASVNISLITVDEAHCVSQWGHDFRPSYLQISDFVSSLSVRPPVLACTATATADVREDIVNMLGLRQPYRFLSSFDRGNLFFEVQKPDDKFGALLNFLGDRSGQSGIVYCATRKTVEEVTDGLNKVGIRCVRYHAGLDNDERQANQEAFIYDNIHVIVATNAFGMGIDKPNVSFVVHFNMPKNMEAYYQEAGRAGRDGEPAHCVLLFSRQDVRTNLWLIENAPGNEYPDAETEKRLKEQDRNRLQSMVDYCNTGDCLRKYILGYFGEISPDSCSKCGNCDTSVPKSDITTEAQMILSCIYRLGGKFGISTVINVLRGSKRRQILDWKLDKLSTYNITSMSEQALRTIANTLQSGGYISISNDRYPVAGLGPNARGVLFEGKKVFAAIASPSDKALRRNPNRNIPREAHPALLKELRKLRAEIAGSQGVPAFVIFTDKTLRDMCVNRPCNMRDFGKISGVGQVKLNKYGPHFVGIISNYMQSRSAASLSVNGDHTLSSNKLPLEALINHFVPSDNPLLISELTAKINSLLTVHDFPRVTAPSINNWLISMGYMTKIKNGATTVTKPTDSGERLGIENRLRIRDGKSLELNYYSKPAQELIITSLKEIIEMSGR